MAEGQLNDNDKIVLIGGSAGSLQVVTHLLNHLKAGLQIPVVIILHRKSDFESGLSTLFGSKTLLPVKDVDEKEPILPGVVYLAPPDYHLLIENDKTFSLDDSEKVHFSRPSIDVTFQTAADAYGAGVIAILLSGANSDGVDGLKAIKKQGGMVVVQDPATAMVPYMPQSALNNVQVDKQLSIEQLPDLINGL